ncbi:hypothetical protein ACFPN2_33570 [Steroidobacter flavus]|uniref:Zorya protein ZorC EH domain-containing protein n=1 Tax=Steroidobacter flavus TaxID=1842136 RepID=A0ABV8T4A1_9GAMM
MTTSPAPAQLNALLDRQRTALPSAGRNMTLQEWQQNNVAPYLRACLAFYYQYSLHPLRWDAIVLAQEVAIRYHFFLTMLESGKGGWFSNSEELKGRPLIADEVLNSADLARLLLIADWAVEHEALDPVVYAMLAKGRADRLRQMDSPNIRQLRRNKAPAAAFVGRLTQAESWLRTLEKRFPGDSLLTTPARHGRWFPKSAHEECAKAYFSCLAQVAPEAEYVAELRRYRRGPMVATAVLACDLLKRWKVDSASDVGPHTATPGSMEAIFAEYAHEQRQGQLELQTLRQQDPPNPGALWNARMIEGIERSLRFVDRLAQHPLRWRVICDGFGLAADAAETVASGQDVEKKKYLKSASFLRMKALGEEALTVNDLSPGLYASLLIHRLRFLGTEQLQDLAETHELYATLTRRWPTLFEFNDRGDAYEWYADKSFRMATKHYFDLLDKAGKTQELEVQIARVARAPHPWAAQAAQHFKLRLEAAKQATA